MISAFLRYSLGLTRPALFMAALVLGAGLLLGSAPRAGQATGCFGPTASVTFNRVVCTILPARFLDRLRSSYF